MDALWLSVPEWFLEDRRAKGLDGRDEVWDGVLHMVPPGTFTHHHMAFELAVALRPIAAARDLVANGDGLGLFAPRGDIENYRVPDISLVRAEHISERGLESAELVIEVRSPNDESYKKLPFYARVGVKEVWIVEPKTRTVEIFTIVDGAFALLPAALVQRSPLLSVTLETVLGPKLRITDGDSAVEI
jgi:Uma2 family endonuclease